jgi:hypothetical protein
MWSVVNLLHENPQWLSLTYQSTYAVNLEREMLENISCSWWKRFRSIFNKVSFIWLINDAFSMACIRMRSVDWDSDRSITNKCSGFSPKANYTHRATAACRRIERIEGIPWSAQWIPTAVNFGLLDRSRYFLEIASQLFSRGWVEPVLDPLLVKNLVSPGNEPDTSWSVARNSWLLYHRGGRSINNESKRIFNERL